ncbi:hypothetical protein ACTJI5_22645 [Sphingopyxis sp. 22461]
MADTVFPCLQCLALSRSGLAVDPTMLQFVFAIPLPLTLLIAGNMPALAEAELLPFPIPGAARLIGALTFLRLKEAQLVSVTGRCQS